MDPAPAMSSALARAMQAAACLAASTSPRPRLGFATVMTLLRSDGDVFAAVGQNANVWETPCKNISNKNAPSFCCS